MFDKTEKVESEGKAGPVGYAVTYIEDFGGGRQVQVNFGLKLGAPKAVMDDEMDKLRLVLNRQRAFGTIRDMTAKLNAERKIIAAIEEMIANSSADLEEQKKVANAAIDELLEEEKSLPKNTPNLMRSQKANILAQARMQREKMLETFEQNKRGREEELAQRKTNIDVFLQAIDEAREEIGE